MAKKKRSAAQRAATGRMLAANRSRGRGKTKRRARARSNPPVRRSGRRRRARRNPPLMALFTRGLMDAAFGGAAQIATMILAPKLPNFIDSPTNGGDGTIGPKVNQAIVALALGFGAAQTLGADRARAIVQGALQAPLVSLATPMLQKAGLLASYGYPSRLSSYVRAPMLASYVQPGQIGNSPQRMLSGDDEEYGYMYGGNNG